MSTDLTHAEVMRLSELSGELIASLYGRPSLVIGVARSGTEMAARLAEAAGATDAIRVVFERPSSRGLGAVARSMWTTAVPVPVRRLYKRLLFRTVVRATSRMDPPLDGPDVARLRDALDAGSRLVVVVDDAIDSGRTAAGVIDLVRQAAPAASVLMFAVATTLDRRITDHQLTVTAGSIVHMVEGDLAALDDPTRMTRRRLARNATDDLLPQWATSPVRNLYLDLDGTLTHDSFRDAARQLAGHLRLSGDRVGTARLLAYRLAKKARLIDHRRLKQALDREIRRLPEPRRVEFERELAADLRSGARPALLSIGNAERVRCAIVTAALSSYRSAIEQAFGFPVLGGSGPDARGRWVEIGSEEKLAAIEGDRAAHRPGPSLLVGDTMADGLVASHDLTVVSIPRWDRTGLVTILGVPTWWRSAP